MGVVVKESIKASVVNYAGVLLGVINVLWLQTAILSEGEIGVIKYLLDLSFILMPFIVLGTSSLPTRFLHRFKTNKSRNSFLSFLFLIPIITLSLLLIGCLLFQSSINAYLGDEVLRYGNFLIYVIPLVSISSYRIIIDGILQANSDIVYSSFLKSIFVRIIFMILLILFYNKIINFLELFQLYVLTFFTELLLLFWYFKKKIKFTFQINFSFLKNPLSKEIMKYSLFLIIGSGGLALMARVDILMITDLMSKHSNVFDYIGIYAISFFIASFIEMPKKTLAQLMYPIFSKLATEKEFGKMSEFHKQASINLSIIGLFLFLSIWYNLDLLFEIVPNGDVFIQGKWVVFFIGMSKLVDMFFGLGQELLTATKYYKYNLYIIPFLIVITVITNYIFIPIYGITGAALATSVTIFLYSLSKCLLVAFLLKISPFSFQYVKVFLVLIVVVLTFLIKPVLFDSIYIEIISNSVIISILFVGGNYLLKSSKELNYIIKKVIKLRGSSI